MSVIHQSRNGITLLDGFYLAKNPLSQYISVISIYKGVVFVHEVTTKMNMDALVQLDSTGSLEIFEDLKSKKELKEKNNLKE